jgi:hypothetical protein
MTTCSDDEVEFHLATLMVDLRALSAMSSMMSRETWLHTVQPLVMHATGVCYALASIVDGEPARCATELAGAIASVLPPEEGSELQPGANDAAWKLIREKHVQLGQTFATTGIKPWVLGRHTK